MRKPELIISFSVLALMIVSIANMWSISYKLGLGTFQKHAISLLLSGMVFFGSVKFGRYVRKLSIPILIVGLLLLALTLVFGKIIFGSKRWIMIMGLSVQPSELAKLCMIAGLSLLLRGLRGISLLFAGILTVAAFFIPVILQPDLGTALSFTFIGFIMMVAAGMPLIWIVPFLGLSLTLSPLIWDSLKEYQKERFLALLNPEQDILGSGYQSIQSKIAIGSGGLFGTGYFKGIQGKLYYIPNVQSDFIFSSFAEEWGFLGSMLLIFLLLAIVFILMFESTRLEDKFSSLFLVGTSSFLFFHVFVNIGMTTGILPVVGLPLSFMSLAGTHNIVAGALIGTSVSLIKAERFRPILLP